MGTKIVHSVFDQIKARILLSRPIPVADYMKLALTQSAVQILNKPHGTTNSKKQQDRSGELQSGYYMNRDVFGPKGDFITSPEISQMFGEMIGVWSVQTWLQVGGPKKFNIVELGPGRGTLAKDVLRVFKKFEHFTGPDVSLHLVEISPFLASLQEQTICEAVKSSNYFDYIKNVGGSRSSSNWIDPAKALPEGQNYYHKGISNETGYPVYWYRDMKMLPNEFNLYLAHEFFDALPIHKLQKVADFQWREVLIDIEPNFVNNNQDSVDENIKKLRYVLSRNETPVIKVLKNYNEKILFDTRNHLEVSLESVASSSYSRITRDKNHSWQFK